MNDNTTIAPLPDTGYVNREWQEIIPDSDRRYDDSNVRYARASWWTTRYRMLFRRHLNK